MIWLSACCRYSSMVSRCDTTCRPASNASAAASRTLALLSQTRSQTTLKMFCRRMNMKAGALEESWLKISAPAKRCVSERASAISFRASWKAMPPKCSTSVREAMRTKCPTDTDADLSTASFTARDCLSFSSILHRWLAISKRRSGFTSSFTSNKQSNTIRPANLHFEVSRESV